MLLFFLPNSTAGDLCGTVVPHKPSFRATNYENNTTKRLVTNCRHAAGLLRWRRWIRLWCGSRASAVASTAGASAGPDARHAGPSPDARYPGPSSDAGYPGPSPDAGYTSTNANANANPNANANARHTSPGADPGHASTNARHACSGPGAKRSDPVESRRADADAWHADHADESNHAAADHAANHAANHAAANDAANHSGHRQRLC